MIFIEWWYVLTVATLLFFGVTAVWLFIAVAKRRALLRVPTRAVALVIATLSFPLASLFMLGMSCRTPSGPKYAPDGKHAIRVIEHDEGATGGGELVYLYWAGGLRSKEIFSAGWKSTSLHRVRWLDNTHLLIVFEDQVPADLCVSADAVMVICKRVASLSSAPHD